MKNNIKNILNKGGFLCLLSITAFFSSCNVTTEEVVLDRNEKPVVNLVNSSVSVDENGTVSIEITSDKATTKDMIFKLYQIEGDAEEGVDFKFAENTGSGWGPVGGQITIPAYTTEGSTTISGLTDFAIDPKSAKFELRPTGTRKGIVGSNNILTLQVNDYLSDDLSLILKWETDDEDNYHAADQDIDIFVTNTSGSVVSSAFTGNMPETLSVLSTLPDGDYFVNLDYWAPSNVTTGSGDYKVRFILTLGRIGVFSTVVENNFTDDDVRTNNYLGWSGYSSYGGNGLVPNVVKITKNGNSYVIN